MYIVNINKRAKHRSCLLAKVWMLNFEEILHILLVLEINHVNNFESNEDVRIEEKYLYKRQPIINISTNFGMLLKTAFKSRE